MNKKYISWETPPKEDQKFAVFTKKNRMIIMGSLKEFEDRREELLKGEEILGWKLLEISKEAPPFIQMPIPKQIDK